MLSWNQKDTILYLHQVLNDDQVVLASSDTVLGLFACVSEKAKKKLDTIKIRNLKPYIILLGSQKRLSDFIDQEIDDRVQTMMNRYWPGPLTIIFKAQSTLPDWMKSAEGTIAIRIPHHAGLQNLLLHIPALFTTSANISSEPLPTKYSDINTSILVQVGAICCDDTIDYSAQASTIVDISSGSINIVRQGDVTIDSF